MPLALAALGVGMHLSTAVRWRKRAALGEALVRRRGPQMPAPALSAHTEAKALVKGMRALIGADALRHCVPGLSRREAARIKGEATREMERERKAGTERVVVSVPGVVRGFDAMHLRAEGQRVYALIVGDGSIPYRTSWALADRYSGRAVEDLLRHDFQRYGAPLVLRMDRARQHGVPGVARLLREAKVLPLHGPAFYAPFYGQLERQNREHREWLERGPGDLDLDTMMAALNHTWRRRTLGWRTAGEAWTARPIIDVDRDSLAEEVRDRAEHLRCKLDAATTPRDLAWRLAVKQALTNRGLLKVVNGGWC